MAWTAIEKRERFQKNRPQIYITNSEEIIEYVQAFASCNHFVFLCMADGSVHVNNENEENTPSIFPLTTFRLASIRTIEIVEVEVDIYLLVCITTYGVVRIAGYSKKILKWLWEGGAGLTVSTHPALSVSFSFKGAFMYLIQRDLISIFRLPLENWVPAIAGVLPLVKSEKKFVNTDVSDILANGDVQLSVPTLALPSIHMPIGPTLPEAFITTRYNK